MDLQTQLVTNFFLGLGAMTSPCVFPLYPGFLAYLGGQAQGKHKANPILLGVLVFLGVLTMMMALGAAIASISVAVGQVVQWITPTAYLIVILLGILLLFDRNPFLGMSQLQVPALTNPYANAFVYGLLYGPIAFPCSGPLLVFIFAQSLTTADMLQQLLIFFFFGLGFGLPLLLLAFLGRAQQQAIVRFFVENHRVANLLAGLVLVSMGSYGLWVEFVSIWLGYI